MEPVGSIVGAIFKLIKEITKTARTARVNRIRCQELAWRTEDVGNVLRAAKAGTMGNGAAGAKRSILCRLREALGDAAKLVESCSRRGSLVSRLHRFLTSSTIAARLKDVNQRISNCLVDLCAASGIIVESKVDRLTARDRHRPNTDRPKKQNQINTGNAPPKAGSKNGGQNKSAQNGGSGGKRRVWKKAARPQPAPSHVGVPSYPNGHGYAYSFHHHSIEEDPTSCSVM